jgi:hypothetical protein
MLFGKIASEFFMIGPLFYGAPQKEVTDLCGPASSQLKS